MKEFAIYPSLKNRRIFITGGATGIGSSIVRASARQGAIVAFIDLAQEAGQALANETGAEFTHLDVTDTKAMQAVLADFGETDCLVNNVANDTRHAWRTLEPAQWDAAMAINLRPAFFAIQAAAPGMIDRRRGSIINFGSISWKVMIGAMPAYTTAKAAIHGLTRSFTTELGAAGVRINTVVPGHVMTERQFALHHDAESEAELRANQKLPGYIQPEDAAALVMFLAADDSAMCTGQEFTIDGGWC